MALRDKAGFHVVVIRSTMLPGTMREVVIPTLEEASGKRAGSDFGVCNNPEFLREGTAVHDYRHPPKTVVGETDARSGDLLVSLYAGIDRAAGARRHRDRRDGQVRRQRLARAEGRLRQRDRQHLQGASPSTATR